MKRTLLVPLMALLFSFSLLVFPSAVPVYAQPQGCEPNCAQKGLNDIGTAFPEGAKRGKNIQEVFKLIINYALYLAAVIAVIFIIIGGYLYITSAGNATQAGKGKQTLINALIGLVLVILSYIIVQIIYNFLTNTTT